MSFARLLTAVILALGIMRGAVHAAEPPKHRAKSPVTVKAELNGTSFTIGEKARYILTVKAPPGTEIKFPQASERLGDFNVRDTQMRVRWGLGTKTFIFTYILVTYETGIHVIPALTVEYRKKTDAVWSGITIEERAVPVESLLEKSHDKAAIRDIKGPVGVRRRLHWPVVLIVLIAAAAALWYVRLRRGRAPQAPEELIPAYLRAYRQLEELARKDLIARGNIKEYFIELSGIVRHYIEDGFRLKAPEMTTEEFLVAARESARLAVEHKGLLREFLACCDLVKFARYAPAQAEIETVFASAKRFVEQTHTL